VEFEADKAFSQALALHRQGQNKQAEHIYRQILKARPRHFDSLHMLGVACRQQGALAEALVCLDLAIEVNPGNAYAHSNRGNVLRDLSRIDEAIASLTQAIRLKPDFAQAYCNRSGILEFVGQLEPAMADLERALECAPGDHQTHLSLGNVLHRMGRLAQALQAYQQALTWMPGNPVALSNMGATLMELQRFDEAEQALNDALALKPSFAQALNNRANVFTATHRPSQALVDIEHALRLAPDFADAWLNRGNVLQDLKRFAEAVASYDRSLALRPDYAQCINNKGNALREMMKPGEALALYEEAIALRPDYAEAHYHRAILLQDLQRYEEAEAAFGQAVRLKEDHPKLYGEWIASRMMICAWDGLDALVDRLATKIREGKNASTTFPLLSCGLTGELVQQCAAAYVRDQCPDRSWRFSPPPTQADRRIRIGYFSSDFRSHAVAQLAAGMFECHDREQFEVWGLNVASFPADAMTQRIDRALGGLVQLGGLSVDDVVAQVRALNLDIAVDLNGHTKGANLHIFANRVAPIQVNYLGYPGTSGAPYFDYILADPTTIPLAHLSHYSEKVAHLTHCYLPSDTGGVIPDTPMARVQHGLPENGFVFCCFNNSYKIGPAVFRVWMRLLGAVPGSVLWLSSFNPGAIRHLQDEARQCGIDPARLVFAPRMQHHADHLARHKLADLFLDTSPYNAHTTAHDALRAGLPVLTCLGEAFQGRVAASLLRAIGLPELVTESLADYEALALELTQKPGCLAALRQRLAQNQSSYPLFDTQGFTQDIESVFASMWARHRGGLAPAHLLRPVLAPMHPKR
jgi:protein O-GlcNAc transferase